MTTAQSVTGASGIPVGYTVARHHLHRRRGRRWCGSCAGWRARRLTSPAPTRLPARPRSPPDVLDALPLVFVLIGLVLYTVLAGADFGAGMWQLMSGGGERGERIRDHCHHSMGPVWEANHVWLIFVLTVFWTAYPVFFGSIASTLAVRAVHRRARHHPARRQLRAALRRRRRLGSCGRSTGSSRSRRLVTPFALGAAAGGDRDRTRPGRQRGGQSHHELAEPDLDPDRPARGGVLRVPRRRLPRRRRGERAGSPTSWRRSACGRSAPAPPPAAWRWPG